MSNILITQTRCAYPEHMIFSGLEDDILDIISLEIRTFNITSGWEGILRGTDFRQWVLEEQATFNATVITESPSRILFHSFNDGSQMTS